MAPKKGSIPPNKKLIDPSRIKQLYETMSTNKIARRLGIARGTVMRVMKEAGLFPYRFHRPGPELTELAKRLYATGMSTVGVAKELGTTHTTVNGRLIKAGVPRRAIEEYSTGSSCDHHFFDVIDTAEKAYWLGVIVTDGCLSHTARHHWKIILTLKASDVAHVNRFRDAIKCTSVVVKVSGLKRKVINGHVSYTRSATLQIESRPMYQALLRHGIVPRKTGRTTMPTGIPDRLLRHFWRGCIDGDGWHCIGRCKARANQYVVGFTGDAPMVKAWRKFCRQFVPTKQKIHRNGEVVKRMVVTDRYAIAVADVLYRRATVYLDRKKKVYLEAKQYYRKKSKVV